MLEVTQAKFGFDKSLKATIFYKIKRHVDDFKGTFPVGFSIIYNPRYGVDQNDKNRYLLVIFKDEPKNIIGECDPAITEDWLISAIKEKSYISQIIYYTGVEPIDDEVYAMGLPIGAFQTMRLDDKNVEGFKNALKLIREKHP